MNLGGIPPSKEVKMKEKLREKIIAISYSNKLPLLRTSIFLLVICIVLGILSCLLKESPEISKKLIFIIWFLIAIWILVLGAILAIGDTQKEITEKNKLLIVVLSSREVWLYIILWGVVSPVLFLLKVENTFINVFVISVIGTILIYGLSKLFSKFFKKRLIK